MISHRFGFVLCFSLVATLMLSVETPIHAATLHTEDILWIREGGVNYRVRVPGNWINYENNENCGDNAHRTSKGPTPRFFGHAHINYSFSIHGNVVGTNVPKTVTVANVKAYWDNEYGIASSGGENATYNCWAYAFGYSIWIQDPSYIYSDDYLSVSVPEVGCVIQQPGHAIKVADVASNEAQKVVTKTSEKNQYSGIYNRTYPLPNGGNFNSFYKKKP